MLAFCFTRSFVILALLLSFAAIGEIKAAPQGVNLDDTVLNAPYSAKRRFTNIEKSADGSVIRTESSGSKARDSKGRTYTADERHWTYLGSLKSEMLYEIDDPVAHTDTRWDSTIKIAKVVHTRRSAGGENSIPSFLASLRATHGDSVQAAMIDGGAVVAKLGKKTIGGIVAEGTRATRNDRGTVTVHETWYCPELQIVILITHDDPRTGSSKDELIDIVRKEPDVKKYRPPADYAIRRIELP